MPLQVCCHEKRKILRHLKHVPAGVVLGPPKWVTNFPKWVVLVRKWLLLQLEMDSSKN